MANLLPEGRYRARAVDADIGETKGGAEQVGVGFEILEGDHQGWHITAFLQFTDAAADFSFEKMRNAGWQGDDLADLSSLCPSSIECTIVIKHETWDGKLQAKVAFVNKLSDGKVKMNAPLTSSGKAAFAARMRAKAIASRKDASAGGGAKAGGGERHPNEPGSDFGPPPDDGTIPF